jgi:hypothetical protein
MATIVTIQGAALGTRSYLKIEELDDAKALTDILTRNGYTFNLRGAN